MVDLGTFDDERQGIVDANGDLSITFECPLNQNWLVTQLTLEMATAPQGCTAVVRKRTALIAPSPSARKAAAAGDPPVPVRSGESISAVWENATPGEVGKAFILYQKFSG